MGYESSINDSKEAPHTANFQIAKNKSTGSEITHSHGSAVNMWEKIQNQVN